MWSVASPIIVLCCVWNVDIVLTPVFSIPYSVDGPLSFPLQSTVEYVSADGLLPETIVSRLSKRLRVRLSHNKDSYVRISTDRVTIDTIR